MNKTLIDLTTRGSVYICPWPSLAKLTDDDKELTNLFLHTYPFWKVRLVHYGIHLNASITFKKSELW